MSQYVYLDPIHITHPERALEGKYANRLTPQCWTESNHEGVMHFDGYPIPHAYHRGFQYVAAVHANCFMGSLVSKVVAAARDKMALYREMVHSFGETGKTYQWEIWDTSYSDPRDVSLEARKEFLVEKPSEEKA